MTRLTQLVHFLGAFVDQEIVFRNKSFNYLLRAGEFARINNGVSSSVTSACCFVSIALTTNELLKTNIKTDIT